MNFYTGIGSRETPDDILKKIIIIAGLLESEGWILRSGGAAGADSAFEDGVVNKSNNVIYLPWSGFSKTNNIGNKIITNRDTLLKAEEIAKNFHGGSNNPVIWNKIKKLMIRNVFQVLGEDLQKPSKFVLCWAQSSKFDDNNMIKDVKGGTGMAVRLAHSLKIPVYNLDLAEHLIKVENFINKSKVKNLNKLPNI
jgi:hypothetical protein